MLVANLLQWWYGDGWKLALQHARIHFLNLGDTFSVPLLLRTLFSPWKRVVAQKGKGLDSAIQAAFDNLIGRLVGFTVRIFVLFAAFISAIFLMFYTVALLIIWPLTPVLIVVGLILGVIK